VSPPRVTVAVLNYNYARFLRAAVDSALDQTHPDVQVVVVDDGSTDDSAAVIGTYGDRVTAVLKSNGGQGSAMNAGFAAATGEVVIFLDADDLLDRNAAARVVDGFTAHPDAAWVMYRLRMVDAEGQPTGRVRPRRPGVMPDGDLRPHLARYRCFHWQPTSGNAFAAWALRKVLPMPEGQYRISADAYLAGVIPLCGTVRSTDAVGGSYRLHGASNFTAATVDEEYFRSQIERQIVAHGQALQVAEAVGVELPRDVRAPHDAAFLGFRLASLLLDPAGHPFPDERRGSLVVQGVSASLRNPQLAWPNRIRRAVWFLACGVTPLRKARELASGWAPDTPARRGRHARREDAAQR
jgi:hypothetical protein